MNSLTTVAEPDADGYLHIQVPEEMRGSRIKVFAEVETPQEAPSTPRAKLVRDKFGDLVLVAPPGAPPMTPERIRAILNDEEE